MRTSHRPENDPSGSFRENFSSSQDQDSKEKHQVTQREADVSLKSIELANARPEYAEGKIKLNYKYTFTTGEAIEATEDKDGIAKIIIKRGDQMIFDFQDLIPNYKFLTPTGQRSRSFRTQPNGEFMYSQFMIAVGDMHDSDPRAILLLLHEVGHGINLNRNRSKTDAYKNDLGARTEWGYLSGLFKKGSAERRKELVELISKSERNAWAEALKITRQIKEKEGLNLLEGFKNFDELEELISSTLLTYRETFGRSMIKSDQGLFNLIKNKVLGKSYGSEQWNFLKNLFDKNRLNRKSISEIGATQKTKNQ